MRASQVRFADLDDTISRQAGNSDDEQAKGAHDLTEPELTDQHASRRSFCVRAKHFLTNSLDSLKSTRGANRDLSQLSLPSNQYDENREGNAESQELIQIQDSNGAANTDEAQKAARGGETRAGGPTKARLHISSDPGSLVQLMPAKTSEMEGDSAAQYNTQDNTQEAQPTTSQPSISPPKKHPAPDLKVQQALVKQLMGLMEAAAAKGKIQVLNEHDIYRYY